MRKNVLARFGLRSLRKTGSAAKSARLFPAADHLEHRARVIVIKTQFEVVEVGDRRRDAQAKPAAGHAMTARGPVEALEYLVPFARLDTDSIVAHADNGTAIFLGHRHAHPAVLGGELDRIADQVRYRLAHQIAIAENLNGRLGL